MARLAACFVLSFILATACGLPNAQSPVTTAGPDTHLAGQAALEVFPAGFDASGTVLRNGATVPLASDLNVEIFVDPYPASGPNVWLDLFVARSGKPIDNAEVTSENTMAYMSHGTSHQDGNNSGDGHYLFALNHPMVGPWRHLIRIQVEDRGYELPLVITAYPS